MDTIQTPKVQYPPLLKALLGVGLLFFGSLGLLLLTLILNMLGFAYGISGMQDAIIILEQISIFMLITSVMLGGVVSMIGLATRSLIATQETTQQPEKAKHENQLYDIREYGLKVEDILSELSISERERLAEKLADSRLAIREDGTLIPLEQAEKLYKIERFIDG